MSITEDSLQIARLEERMASVQRDIETLTERVNGLHEQLADVLGKLNEARGGWRVLMLLGGASAALGALLTWAVQHVSIKP